MIVVCGALESKSGHPGSSHAIAAAAARAGAVVQVIGIVPDGAEGDRLILELAEAGIGHAAVLRTMERPMEPADLSLALRYLPEVDVVIGVELGADLLSSLAAGAAFAGAPLVVVEGTGGSATDDPSMPVEATVLVAPASDPDGTFAGFVAAFAVRLDRAEVPADAWAATLEALAVDPVR